MQPASRAICLLAPSKPLSEAMCDVILQPEPAGSPARGGRARGPLDLSRMMVLVPGGRLAHAVERRLLGRARAAGRPLFAPSIVTPLMFAGRLVAPGKPVLSTIASRLSWREVLEESRRSGDGFSQRVASVFGGAGEPDARATLRLAQRMQRLASEVAASMRSIRGVAASETATRRPELARRLAVLAEFAERRDALLARVRLPLEGFTPKHHTHAGPPQADSTSTTLIADHVIGIEDRDDALREAVLRDDIVTDGVDRVVVLLADPEMVQRQLLTKLAARGVRVDVCVHSRESLDDEGFPIGRAWEQRGFADDVLPTASVHMADGPGECAHTAIAVIRDVARIEGRAPTSEDVALVAPDAETRRELERALAMEGSPAAAAEGRPFPATRTGSLLVRLAELVREQSAAALAVFVRHDDVATWLRDAKGVVGAESAVTRYRAATLVGSWRDEVVDAADGAERFREVRAAVIGLVQPLDESRAACAWARPIREVVRVIVGEDARGAFAGERLGSIRALDGVLAELAEVPSECSAPLACHEAIGLVMDELGRREIRGESHTDGVSILGWLDAGMADERVLVLAGFAEGSVPQRAPADPVLQDEVRGELGLPSGRRFAARDAWILDGILARARARREGGGAGRVVFIVPRRTAEGDPQKPSRFLLRVADDALPQRVTHLFGAEPAPAVVATASAAGAADFRVKPPVPGARIESVRVTAFKTFIQCPYLFQLQIDPRLRLRATDEHAVELDAMAFGTLVHAALEGWGREEAGRGQRTEDAAVIEQSVCQHLDQHVQLHFPRSRAAALRVQVEIARARLRRFAALQAEQARQGWRVHSVECSFAREPVGAAVRSPRFPAEEQFSGVHLTGRIDRVDVLDGVGRFRAVDYKTSSSGDTPTDTHMKIKGGKKARRVEWLDLQLPLYRVLLRSLSPAIDVAPGDLGYINLAPSAEKSGFSFLEASEADIEQAEALARSIVERICAGDFVPAERVPVRSDDPLAVIWGLGMRPVLDGAPEALSQRGGAE